MNPPLQALLISNDHAAREGILSGSKTGTVRSGHRDYRPGIVMICYHLEPWVVMADIVTVRHTKLADLTETEWRADGFETFEELVSDLRKFYSDIGPESPVTFVGWANVRGRLVDEFRASIGAGS